MSSSAPPSSIALLGVCLALSATAPLSAEKSPILCAVTFTLPAEGKLARPHAAQEAIPAAEPGCLPSIAHALWRNLAPDSPQTRHEPGPAPRFATLAQKLAAAGRSEDLDALAAVAARNPPASMFVPPPPPPAPRIHVPNYDLWLERVAERPRPSRADYYLPRLRAAFVAEGIPPELVWIAETESSFDPRARGNSGERGLFQLMPDTARGFGIHPEERIQPVRSARAAASYLRYLHQRFGDWPLALAAYNAGESRVARELKRRDANSFASIARHLPVETRFYVPKVLATVQLRSGVRPENLGPPVSR